MKRLNKIEKLITELCPNGVEFKELGELGDFYSGLTGKSKDDFNNGNSKFIAYMNIFSNIAVDTDVDIFVKIKPNEKQNKIQFGDILFTGSSETPNDCGMSSVLTKKTDESLYLNSFCFGFRFYNTNLLLPEFSKYLFRDEQIRKQIEKTASGVTRFNISKKRFAKIKIPLPPLPIQQEIVKILDKFDALVNGDTGSESGMTGSLPAELKARRQQYEYYRNKLLTFTPLDK
jgi:type I restriction enzyme, S subunit